MRYALCALPLFLLSLLVGCSTNRDLKASPSLPANQDLTHPPPTDRELIVLLPDPDGKVGSVRVITQGGSQVLDKPGYATQVKDGNKPLADPKQLDEKEINDVFGAALSAQPDLSGRFILFVLYFERDTTKLTQESKELLPEVVRTIQNRKPSEIYVVGHTDRVGTDAYNMGLSQRRASFARDLLTSTGIPSSTLVVSFRGESMPLVPTEDEVPEPRNRRVEVIAR
jgi:outer membrane protein OmpA-like peptidoglycan-associated protein